MLGCIENMFWLESRGTCERAYVFGKGGGTRLALEIRTDLIGQIPLGQPDWNEEDFAPSVYADDHPIGLIYTEIANRILEKTNK